MPRGRSRAWVAKVCRIICGPLRIRERVRECWRATKKFCLQMA